MAKGQDMPKDPGTEGIMLLHALFLEMAEMISVIIQVPLNPQLKREFFKIFERIQLQTPGIHLTILWSWI